jgi:hypothetical protein
MIINEKIIYISITIVFGILLISFIANIPINSLTTKISSKYFGDENLDFMSLNLDEFYKEVLDFWISNKNSDGSYRKTFYVDDTRNITKEIFFNFIKENHFCNTINSKSFDCGSSEDTVIEPINFPKLVTILYENNTLFILNEGFPRNEDYLHSQITYLSPHLGSGNISVRLEDFPLDAKISLFKLYGSISSNFNLTINNKFCKSFHLSDDIHEYDLGDCINYLKKDEDNFVLIQFNSVELLRHNIKGGQFLILYSTEQENEPLPSNKRIYFPEINGSILIFDGINIPGTPNSVDFHLHYEIEEPQNGSFKGFFGGEIKIERTSGGEYTNSFSIPSGDLYSGGNSFTFGFFPNSTEEDLIIYKPFDVVLITDVSGSMIWRMDDFVCNGPLLTSCDFGNKYDCNHPDLRLGSTARISVAKCFSLDFVDIILNEYIGNQIGLVSFSTGVKSFLPLTEDYNLAKNEIENYDDGGDTCIGCGIKKAHDLLQTSDRSKVIVLMTDGGERMYLAGKTALEYAQLAAADNISLFTISLGDHDGANLLRDIACLTNCSNYAQGMDVDNLEDIYNDFARIIAEQTFLNLKISKISNYHKPLKGRLFDDSYFNIEYTPLTTGTRAKMLVIDKINSSDNFIFPKNMTIELAEFLVWSDGQWIDNVILNDNSIFNLSRYGRDYDTLSDSFNIYIPPSNLERVNNVDVFKGNIENKETFKVEELYIQYVVTIPSTDFTIGNYDNALGCHWEVLTPQGIIDYTIPISYTGSSFCKYNYTNSTFDENDMYQDLANYFFKELDLNNDGIINSKLDFISALGGLGS